MPRQPHFQSRLDDGADERSEPGISMLNVKPVAGPTESDWQHARGMDQLHRGIHGKVGNDLAAGMGLLPLAHGREMQGRAMIERSFEQHGTTITACLARSL